MLGIIDYGAGNIGSVRKALDFLGAENRLVALPEELQGCTGLILPGVGAFGPAAEALRKSGMAEALQAYTAEGGKLLGICLGMQLLFEESEEFGIHRGLGLIPGRIVPIRAGKLPVPHMGWNSLALNRSTALGERAGEYVYFVHSFRADTAEEYIGAYTDYGGRIPATVSFRGVTGAQFHPEKSGDIGIRMLSGFCRTCTEPSAK